MDTDWMDDAACRGCDTETFFTADDFTHPQMGQYERQALNAERMLRAAVICAPCPVRRQCRIYGGSVDGELQGVYGGLAPDQRVMYASGVGSDVVREVPYQSPEVRAALSQFREGASLSDAAGRNGLPVREVRECARRFVA